MTKFSKLKHQVKSNMYYIFWGACTAAVMAGQIYVGNGYRKMSETGDAISADINLHFPDWRRILNECQRYSVGGKIDSGILVAFSNVTINELTKYLKEKNFAEVRKWVTNHLDNDGTVMYRNIYNSLYKTLVSSSIPAAILILAKYQYQVAFVADQEINMLACLTEIMVECTFK